MVTDEEIERAVDWLRDNAEDCARARSERIFMEETRKRLKAVIMREHADKAIGSQEREAYADPRYLVHLEGMKEAIYRDEKLRLTRDAATAKIEFWRSLSANLRGKL